ncbi:MAG TPA: hypothetical protein VFV38_31750 [Ktedonobacteraceae bacterium]|nr:hypothetical protein [Ktedonobacteraceae bacterium]
MQEAYVSTISLSRLTRRSGGQASAHPIGEVPAAAPTDQMEYCPVQAVYFSRTDPQAYQQAFEKLLCDLENMNS